MTKDDVLNKVIKEMTAVSGSEPLFTSRFNKKMPSKDAIIKIIDQIRKIIFPGYFDDACIKNDEYCLGYSISNVYEQLYTQVRAAMYYTGSFKNPDTCAEKVCNSFFENLPKVQQLLLKDIKAGFDGDPAAKSMEEIIYSYPGLLAIYVYRIAHILYTSNVPLIPRIMTEYAHSLTGIDINSGAEIGEYFFIDHGTGVVIGETTHIGNNVKLYQGVTLGALSTRSGQQLAGVKRHPTICDNVTIYAGSTILGGETVIGENTIIGGNCFITASVPENSKVSNKPSELIVKPRKMPKTPKDWEI
ncbi:MAG: serine acetyltransferase [Clostridia bacterium]|nr:serine acetyltransferase [Clostridia bacterium]